MTQIRRVMLAVILAVVALGWALPAFAQGTTVRFYIVPKVGTGTHPDPFRAKYLDDDPATYPGGTGGVSNRAGLQTMDYGLEPIFFVGANVTAGEDAVISAQPDVIAVPAGNLDSLPTTLGLSNLKTNLEALKIPAGWINATHSYREIVRFVLALFQVFQRYHAVANNTLFTAGITLDSTFGQLSAGQRANLQQVASDLGISTAGVTNATTLRQALRVIAPQLPNITVTGTPF